MSLSCDGTFGGALRVILGLWALGWFNYDLVGISCDKVITCVMYLCPVMGHVVGLVESFLGHGPLVVQLESTSGC